MRAKRSLHDASDSDMNDSIDNMSHDDIFAMQPQITINESPRFDSSNATAVKREGSDVISRPQSPAAMYRNTYSELKVFKKELELKLFSTDSSNPMQSTSFPYFPDFSPNDQSINNNGSNNGSIDMSKAHGHMDVPPGKR